MSDMDQPGRRDDGQGPDDLVPTAGPDPLGGDAAPRDPTDGGDPAPEAFGGGSASTAAHPAQGSSASIPRAGEDDRVMVIVAHVANIVGMFTGGLGNVVALILAYVKKGSAPDWAHSHYTLAIRTVWIALAAAIALIVLAMIAVPLSFIGVGLLMFPIIGLASVALMIWVIVRSALALSKALRDEAYPNPETWTI